MNLQQTIVTLFVLVFVAAASISLFRSMGDDDPGAGAGGGEAIDALGTIRAPSRDATTWTLPESVSEPALRSSTTESGVVIEVLREGKGKPVKLGRPIDVFYRGYLLSGRKFDEGVMRGLVFGQKDRVIPGFMEGLEGIRPRERRRLRIPNEQAYGLRAHGSVPAQADLVFEVEWALFEKTVLREGRGRAAKLGDRVMVHYTGVLANGEAFDSSIGGEPRTFTLKSGAGGVIQGWVYGLENQKEGAQVRLWVPTHMAYGAQPRSGSGIPPWAHLTFEIELIRVLPAEE